MIKLNDFRSFQLTRPHLDEGARVRLLSTTARIVEGYPNAGEWMFVRDSKAWIISGYTHEREGVILKNIPAHAVTGGQPDRPSVEGYSAFAYAGRPQNTLSCTTHSIYEIEVI